MLIQSFRAVVQGIDANLIITIEVNKPQKRLYLSRRPSDSGGQRKPHQRIISALLVNGYAKCPQGLVVNMAIG